jgi:hypothetical protein
MTFKDDIRGQATVMTVLFLTVLLGMAALVLDVGSWYRADRQIQQTADSAALAGAQALPEDPGQATALAIQYANKNGGGLDGTGIAFSSKVVDHDTITVRMTKPAPGFFSRVLGLNSVTVGAHAAARAGNISAARYVAPIVVNWKHPMLQCKPLPCHDPTEIDLADLHKPGSGDAAGAFGLINLNQDDNGSVGSQILGDEILHGFDKYLPLGQYNSVPSAKFNSSFVRNALDLRIGTELLFPVYKTITGPGDNAVYTIIGWVGFRVTRYDTSGSTAKVYGSFTRRISTGILVKRANDASDFGARAVQLVD